MTKRGASLVLLCTSALTFSPIASRADVLCKNKKGAVRARSACKAKETQLTAAELGFVQWALVKHDGTILAQSGGISVTTDLTCSGGVCSCAAPGPCNALYYVDFGASQANKVIQVSATDVSSTCTANATCESRVGAIVATLCGGGTAGTTCEAPGTNDNSHVVVYANNAIGGELSLLQDFFISVH